MSKLLVSLVTCGIFIALHPLTTAAFINGQVRSSNRLHTTACSATNSQIGRRDAIVKTVLTSFGGVSTLITTSSSAHASEKEVSQGVKPVGSSFDVFKVIPDATAKLSPTLEPISSERFLNTLSRDLISAEGGALWLGEHHNSATDHNLQEDIIRSIHAQRGKQKPMAIGLEQVQIQFQPALDDFVQGKITEQQMLELVDWEKRWFWSYDVYRPVFELARERQIPLIALNVNSEDLAEVEEGGFPALSPSRLRAYITDPYGFADFAKLESFQTYVDYVIKPSYDLHQQMGLLKNTISGQYLEKGMSFRNFFSGRILWDEGMACMAYKWTKSNPGGLLIGLVGADHVKFSLGIPGRYARMAGDSFSNTAVMLNPTLIDTRPSGSVSKVIDSASSQFPERITLQLRYVKDGLDVTSPSMSLPENTGGVLPLADYIVVSANSS